VYVLEECSCATTHGSQLAAYLQRRLGPQVEVASLDRSHLIGLTPVPPGALEHLELLQNAKLPALVVDGRLRTEGVLPDFLDAVALIEDTPTLALPADAVVSQSSPQCAPGSC
jgi:hypothetical protein